MAETSSTPVNYGVIVFPGFQALDVFGPLDILNTLGRERTLRLSIIAATLDPVSTKPPSNMTHSSPQFAESIVPTHTFETAPKDLEVLIVPGGMGTRNVENMTPIHPFLKKVVPTLRYLLTVCTGSALVAQTGLLDNRKATSNKRSWSWVIAQGPLVNWVPQARWVVDDPGNGAVPVWSSSGIAAGMDATFAFVKSIHGQNVADDLANSLEYERHEDSSWDPYAKIWGVPGAVRVIEEDDMVAKK